MLIMTMISAAVGTLSLLTWYSEPEDAQDYQKCSAKCNQEVVECYWNRTTDDDGTKCDDQWSKCNEKCERQKSSQI